MKHRSLCYREWPCILAKKQTVRKIDSSSFRGYLGLVEIVDVTEPQMWDLCEEEINVCDKGWKWLGILPEGESYCITAMFDKEDNILLWYIDMIADQSVDESGMPWFHDLYLDLVVHRNGTVRTDDFDELEAALANGDITKEQFDLALRTAEKLKSGLLRDVEEFVAFTRMREQEISSVSENS